MDAALEQFETRLKLEGESEDILKIVRDLRQEVNNFLKYLGISIKKKDIYNEIYTTCIFFETYLIEMEPKRFQKGYGKLESESEEKAIERFLLNLDTRIQELKKECESKVK
ncbi:hypothetical protein ANME2D_02964 [Candidatus Methanoperedens nitroreducens]|uniref:Uncharacterized protein n=1 Tax=Candidatus Methanoperedens nitratireducens TaxID=1392998 RepID=A0A062V0R9_9EURY|nr:hypothetical protein [Candidatus Methanoperedens nitroreducens]KCZ70937.1 hypothetical protein ANME2D_02964 [Candidatus Methanoperedens nitroreducens]MDJ1421696.1 hypothetical protein [Candidatus Methanoperedens sp.]